MLAAISSLAQVKAVSSVDDAGCWAASTCFFLYLVSVMCVLYATNTASDRQRKIRSVELREEVSRSSQSERSYDLESGLLIRCTCSEDEFPARAEERLSRGKVAKG